jgi:DNA-binding Lrp family transcriptional regulator
MTSAFVMIQVGNTTDLKGVHSALHAVPGVKTVYFLAGPTDVIAFVDVADQAGMMDAIGKIRAVKGVTSTDTRIVVPV